MITSTFFASLRRPFANIRTPVIVLDRDACAEIDRLRTLVRQQRRVIDMADQEAVEQREQADTLANVSRRLIDALYPTISLHSVRPEDQKEVAQLVLQLERHLQARLQRP